MRAHIRRRALGMLMVLALAADPAAANQFVEDFSTTNYMDEAATTADWNIVSGELRLLPLPSPVGSTITSGSAQNVVVAGDLAYMADGTGGLQVVDISNPSNPLLIGDYDTPGFAGRVAIAGDLAFLADGTNGLLLINIIDPADPVLAGSYNTPGFAQDVAVAGDQAFVADGTAGLRVVDISDPANPVPIGSHNTASFAYGVKVAGDLAFVADGLSGLQIIDISDPTNPALVSALDTPGLARKLAVSGDHVFVADQATGLLAIDISDPANPVIVGTFDTADLAYDVVVDGDLALVADGFNGLQLIDISDPLLPVPAGAMATQDKALGVAVDGALAFVADQTGGLQVIAVRAPTSPVLAGSHDTPGFADHITVAGDLAFLGDYSSGLQIFDISDPTSPVLAGNFDTPGQAGAVALSGDIAIVADGSSGVQLIDISDPSNPVFAGNYDTPDNARNVTVAGDLAFVADNASGLLVIDISDPTSPALAGAFGTPGEAYGVAVAGDLAFVVDRFDGIHVIDISDPANTALVGTIAMPDQAYDVAVAGDLAFVAAMADGLQVVDVSDPTNPTLVGGFVMTGLALDVAVAGDLVLVANHVAGLQVFDVSAPANPVLTGTYDTPEAAFGVALAGDRACVADHMGGLQVVDIFQREVTNEIAIGQSLTVDGASDVIPRARLASTETAGVAWQLSADAGADWTAFTADDSWLRIATPGDELRWRSTHTWSPGLNPTVSVLTLDWLNEFGPITAVSDIPDDQGGRVLLRLTRSGYDFADEIEQLITSYNVWLRIDDAAAREMILDEGIDLNDDRFGDGSSLLDWRGTHYLAVLSGGALGAMPPGIWASVGSFPAIQQPEYGFIAETLADSTAAGNAWSVFTVTAHTASPVDWYACPPDSGYSVDNLAPGVPAGFRVDHEYPGGASLAWDESPEADFQFFRVYRGDSEDFPIGPETLVHETVETGWIDAAGETGHFYQLTALDHAGNESEAAAPGQVTGIDGPAAPRAFALYQNSPNPFNPSTTIRFDLPRSGNVLLAVFDLAGRRVATLLDEPFIAGRHSAIWRGKSDAGHPVSSGLYLYRLQTPDFTRTRRMLLVQ